MRPIQFPFMFVCIAISACQATGPGNNDSKLAAKKDTCSIRYDFAMGAGKKLIERLTCEKIYALHSICYAELKVWYFDMAPYIYTLPDGTVDGIIPGLLNIAFKICCSNCTKLIYLKPFEDILETSEHFHNSSHYSIMLPVLSVLDVETYFTKPFLRLMDTPGVVYVTIDRSAWTTMMNMLNSLANTWPLFLITLLLAIQGGVIIWILDARKNPNDFPSSFTNGFLEGSWWAFVSMTTVGYGDKAPRSFFGRLFAILWITVGITIMGIFTASLSSSLTSAALPAKTKLNGLKIGFMQHIGLAYEENIIHNEGGSTQGFGNVTDAINALRRNEIDGILMDTFVFRYYRKKFEMSRLLIAYKYDIGNSKTSIGLMFSSDVFDNWRVFFKQFFHENKDAESRLLKDAIIQMKEKTSLDGRIVHQQNEIQPTYILIIKALGISSGSSVLIGIIFEFIKNYLNLKRNGRKMEAPHQMGLKWDGVSFDERFDKLSKAIEKVVIAELRGQMASLKHEIIKSQNNHPSELRIEKEVCM